MILSALSGIVVVLLSLERHVLGAGKGYQLPSFSVYDRPADFRASDSAP